MNEKDTTKKQTLQNITNIKRTVKSLWNENNDTIFPQETNLTN